MRMTPGRAVRAFRRVVNRPRQLSPRTKQNVVRRFHQLYYYGRKTTWENTFWLNVPTAKCPFDLWVYQEIICEVQPDIIIETGTAHGGSALFMSSICELVNRGRIITIDIEAMAERPAHKRIKYVSGSSTSTEVVAQVRTLIKPEDRVMVVLDSDHRAEHVVQELQIYSSLVTAGSYLIVEDTNANGHPVLPLYGAGPWEAVEQFLSAQTDFVQDRGREKFFMTFNPRGYLRKVR